MINWIRSFLTNRMLVYKIPYRRARAWPSVRCTRRSLTKKNMLFQKINTFSKNIYTFLKTYILFQKTYVFLNVYICGKTYIFS